MLKDNGTWLLWGGKNSGTYNRYCKSEGRKIQESYYDYILKLNPKRVIFNPGTENVHFAYILTKNFIKWENSCTLVLLSTNQY